LKILFTNSLPKRTFEQLVYEIGLRHLNDTSLIWDGNKICDEKYSL